VIKRLPLRIRSVGFKVTESEFARLKLLAEACQKPLGEWCRDIVLEFAHHPAGTPAEQAVLAEVIGLRTIVANLIFTFTSGGTVTGDEMAGFVERADSTKLQRAIELLRQIRNSRLASLEPQGEKR
jgi:hypothetical protein